jgi:hypothetical protein
LLINIQTILYQKWQAVVRDYTHRNLTFGTDIFPALSGLAQVFQRHLNDQYVASLWKMNLLQELLWHGSGWFKQTSDYRAPTWSWACVDRPVTFSSLREPDLKWNQIAFVQEVVVSPLNGDVTGQLSGGHLRLSGFLIKLDIRKFPEPPSLPEATGRSLRQLRFNYCSNTTATSLSTGETDMAFYPAEPGIGMVDLQMAPSIDNLREAKEFIVMPLLYNGADGHDAGASHGLILALVGDIAGRYRKVGTFTFFPRDIQWKLLRSCQPMEPEYHESFIERVRDGRKLYLYTVTII